MWQPQSIRSHLAAVFLLFFALVVILGAFSIWRLSNFDALSADVAEVWLPTTRALGDLNNYTSDFRAFEGGELLSSDPSEAAATEKQMEELDLTIADSEREFEAIRHDAAENELYGRFKAHWNDYRAVVNQMLVMWRNDHKVDALQIYGGASRTAYNAASDTLGQLTDQAVASAQVASDRLAVAYRQAFWLILFAIVIAAVLVVAALIHISRSISAPLLDLADRMRRLAANDTDIDVPETKRTDEIGEMAQATAVFRNNAIDLMRSQRMLARQAALLEEQLAHEQRLALLQRNFVSMASHEFRTPLTIIDGHARRLDKIKDAVKPAEISERAGKVRSAVLRMTHLIENFLNSSRLIDGGAGLYLQPADMDMTALLQEVCQLHREMVPARTSSNDLPLCRCPWSATLSCYFRCSAMFLPTPSNIRPVAARSWSMPKARPMRSSLPSPTTASEFRKAISAACSSAITAVATSRASSVPVSAFTSSRWRSICIAAASMSRARKARGRASPSACRAGRQNQ